MRFLLLSCLLCLCGCSREAVDETASEAVSPGPFEEDVAFLEKHTDVVVLQKGSARLAVVPEYQGRVMTSTTAPGSPHSFGWLNYDVIKQGILPPEERKGKLEDHIFVFGGEERFWMGPEGGQFSIFFKPGDPFEFEVWKTPAAIDTEAFRVVSRSDDRLSFAHECELTNHSGTRFSVGVERSVRLLGSEDLTDLIPEALMASVEVVAYETDNVLINQGKDAWTKETGLLSIWLLGMYKPSPETIVVIPVKQGEEEALGPVVNDAYFGKVPPEHLQVKEGTIFFKGDGTRRGKIGISPERSKGIAGSYDAAGQVLNLVTYPIPDHHDGYVNSMWELQEQPFVGDVINSYNDGSPAPGLDPLGPFYELETSSPAAALAPGERIQHVQRTVHIAGSPEVLDQIARKTLGVGLDEITAAFGVGR